MNISLISTMVHGDKEFLIERKSPDFIGPYSWELISNYWIDIMIKYSNFPIYISALYIALIFGIQSYMKDKEPLKLKWTMFFWNMGLGIFSAFGFLRLAQEFLSIVEKPNGLHNSICVRSGLNHSSLFWSIAFSYSKIIELGDTLFIVFRKQKLIFLQWFHHCVALTLAWKIVPFMEPITRWFAVMNFGVHGIMYPYFALKTLKFKVPRNVSMVITSLQTIQMVIAVVINIYSFMMLSRGVECSRATASLNWTAFAYGSFLILFIKFFYNSYIGSTRKKQA